MAGRPPAEVRPDESHTSGAMGKICEVWVADLAHWGDWHVEALLDDAERSRARALRQPDDRLRFMAGVSLLKRAVARMTGRTAVSVMIDRRCATCGGPHGRPRVVGSGVQVSVAHSGARVMVALTEAGPVGVDVEVRAGDRASAVARYFLAEDEPVDQVDDVLTYWCRKESVVKATGEGLRAPLREVVVSPASAPARLMRYRGRVLAAQMVDLVVGDGYAAAVTVLTAAEVAVKVSPAGALVTTA